MKVCETADRETGERTYWFEATGETPAMREAMDLYLFRTSIEIVVAWLRDHGDAAAAEVLRNRRDSSESDVNVFKKPVAADFADAVVERFLI